VSRPPLDGITVLDLSRVLAGPYAAMLLADIGARVIKVERPGTGDDSRSWGPPFVGGESTYYLSINRNKESVELDLKDERDREVLRGLAARADVLIENFRPGVMERLGFGADVIEQLNPRLVTLSISGFGSTGPDRQRTGYDQILQAEGGIMSLTGQPEGGPTKVGVPIADLLAGTFGALGVLAALHERDEQSGRGQVVETSLLASQIAIHSFQGTRWLVAGEVPGLAGNHHPTVCPYGLFATADRPLVIAVGNDAIWRRFAPLVGLDPTAPRHATNAQRLAHRSALEDDIRARLRREPAARWLERFAEHGVPAGEVRTLDQVYAAPQVREQGLVVAVEHPSLGSIELPGPPLRFGRSAARRHQAPPTLGQHSAAIRDRVDSHARGNTELDAELTSRDPLAFPGYPASLARAKLRSGRPEAVRVTNADVAGQPAVLIEFDFGFLGGSLGEATGEKIVRAFGHARRRRVPVVSLIASGGARMQEGMRSLLQLQRIAAAAAQARAAGIPHIAVLRQPTTGGVWVTLASTADVVLAEPGAQVSFAGSRVRDDEAGAAFTAEGKLAAGFADAPMSDETLVLALTLLSPRSRGIPRAADVPRALGDLRPSHDGWDSVNRARNPRRPRAKAYLDDYFDYRLELSGDRAGGVDPGMLIGVGRRDDRSIAYAAQAGTATTPAGFRAATRLVRLADALGLPVLTLIDTPGAAHDAAAEDAGAGTAIGELFAATAAARVPVTSLVIGEGGSGGALALASHDRLWIAPDAYFSVIAPEAATAILKRAPADVPAVASDLRISPRDLLELGVVAGIAGDATVEEPAHLPGDTKAA
jgi:acetyl-CoA carboxylase carboxyl transferase subunit beta